MGAKPTAAFTVILTTVQTMEDTSLVSASVQCIGISRMLVHKGFAEMLQANTFIKPAACRGVLEQTTEPLIFCSDSPDESISYIT